MKTFFLTGGTGFIGSHVVNILGDLGHEIRALRRVGSRPRVHLRNPPSWFEGEIAGDYSDALKGVDTLIHLAGYGVGQGEAEDWDKCFQYNVYDSIPLYLQAAQCGVKRFITIGSCFEYGTSGENFDFIPEDAPLNPTSAYAASKASFTIASLTLAVEKKVEMAVLRPFHVFGEGEREERFWPSLLKAAKSGQDFKMTAGEQIRDFIPVEIIAKQVTNFALKGKLSCGNPVIYNLGTGSPKSLKDFARYWWEKFDADGKLLIGSLSYRPKEVMRYVPRVSKTVMDFS